ncbi:PilZ domain-containing protein [Desulfobotulus sp.]|uniref:PilZ domain-containing protein n=1 Tax=Desulfobotulus sp. TaxID=1940337 RepID=UPI002A36DBF6|nr:PilZ domain-containing protein [Desulfobotulus sp.]MDY0161682.1 PilZ domain-containing protein [Desulfobotulus sp.]
MYRIFKSETENCLLLRMRGLVTEEEAVRLIQELTSTLRTMRKGFGLAVDLREYSPKEGDNADFMVKNALRIMAIKKPAVVARIAIPQVLKRMDRVYAEMQLPVTFKVKNATSMAEMVSILVRHRLQISQSLGRWILTLPEDIEKKLLQKNLSAKDMAPSETENILPIPPFIRGFSISGNPVRHELIRIEVDTDEELHDEPYTFEFGYRRLASPSLWQLMPKTEKNHSRTCRFNDAGRYEICVRVSQPHSPTSEPLLTELRIPLFISPAAGQAGSEKKIPPSRTDFLMRNNRCFLLQDRDGTTPCFMKTIIYEVNMDTQTVVVSQPSPPLKSLKGIDTLDLTATEHNDPDQGRPGIQILSLETLSRYMLPDGQAQEALMLRFTLPVQHTGLRNERQAFRCCCLPYAHLMAGKIRTKELTFTSKHDFRFSDISMTGIGLRFPGEHGMKLPDTDSRFLLEFFFEAVEGTLADIHINAEIQLVRKETDPLSGEITAGFSFLKLDADQETLLARHINALQLLERQRMREQPS